MVGSIRSTLQVSIPIPRNELGYVSPFAFFFFLNLHPSSFRDEYLVLGQLCLIHDVPRVHCISSRLFADPDTHLLMFRKKPAIILAGVQPLLVRFDLLQIRSYFNGIIGRIASIPLYDQNFHKTGPFGEKIKLSIKSLLNFFT